jgi:hypothetical protein
MKQRQGLGEMGIRVTTQAPRISSEKYYIQARSPNWKANVNFVITIRPSARLLARNNTASTGRI